jgi:hypothetical protein
VIPIALKSAEIQEWPLTSPIFRMPERPGDCQAQNRPRPPARGGPRRPFRHALRAAVTPAGRHSAGSRPNRRRRTRRWRRRPRRS